jgi:hypothetical protein
MSSSNSLDKEDSDEERDVYFEGNSDMHSEGYSDAYSDEDSEGEEGEEDTEGEEEEEEASEAGSDKIPAFPQFPNLPTELQTKIWEYATPNPRDVPDAILVFVNFDLSRPRAILPSPEYVTRLYDDIEMEHFETAEDDPTLSVPVWDLTLRGDVGSLLHACHHSRVTAGQVFSLDLEESVENWNPKLWDPVNDTLYLKGLASSRRDNVFLWWLSDSRKRPYIGFISVEHIALKLDTLLATWLLPEADIPSEYEHFGGNNWLDNLPSMQTINLCIDPLHFSKYKYGQADPYPPLDVPVRILNNFTPSQIQREVTKSLEEQIRDDRGSPSPRPARKAPTVEVSVLCWRSTVLK